MRTEKEQEPVKSSNGEFNFEIERRQHHVTDEENKVPLKNRTAISIISYAKTLEDFLQCC